MSLIPEHDDLDVLPGLDDQIARDHRQPVGQDHRSKNGRALLSRQARAVSASPVRGERHPQIATPVAGVRDGLQRHGPDARAMARGADEV